MPRKKKLEAVGVPAPVSKPRESGVLPSAEELGLLDLVNEDKAKRAILAAHGREKPQTSEGVLAARYKAAGLDGVGLIRAIYVGLAGLVDAGRAAVNRKNEKKMKAEKASK